MRKALVVLALVGLSACSGGSDQSSSPAPAATPSPAATPASTPQTTASEQAAGATPSASAAAEDQSDYYAATGCKIYGDIAARLRAGGDPDQVTDTFAATGAAGDAADLNGAKWSGLTTALDLWVQAIPEPAKRSQAEQAVNAQCAKVPASIRSAAGVLPNS